jgi:hypothetical protein
VDNTASYLDFVGSVGRRNMCSLGETSAGPAKLASGWCSAT